MKPNETNDLKRIDDEQQQKALNGFLLILTCDGEVFYTSHTVETYLGFHQVSHTIQSKPYDIVRHCYLSSPLRRQQTDKNSERETINLIGDYIKWQVSAIINNESSCNCHLNLHLFVCLYIGCKQQQQQQPMCNKQQRCATLASGCLSRHCLEQVYKLCITESIRLNLISGTNEPEEEEEEEKVSKFVAINQRVQYI